MLELVLLTAALASTPAPEVLREVTYEAYTLTLGNTTPTFDHGYLVGYGTQNVVVYAPGGKLAYRVPYEKHGTGEHGTVTNVAVDTDGIAAAAWVRDYNLGGISFFDPSGTELRFVDTGKYSPSFVCFGPDHSLWVSGSDAEKLPANDPGFLILRHFSRDGKQLGAFLPASSFDIAHDELPNDGVIGATFLHIANGRIGLYLYGKLRTWVELNFAGQELGRWHVSVHGLPRAVTANGNVYGQAEGKVWVLDHAKDKWKAAFPEHEGMLIGSDGDALVFLMRNSVVVRWLQVPTGEASKLELPSPAPHRSPSL